ncbi:MAG TPA: tetratricopeptide repeat protein [Pyrinomonadaceae bacterium]
MLVFVESSIWKWYKELLGLAVKGGHMNRSFLLIVLLFLFPTDQFQAQTQPTTDIRKPVSDTNPEARSLYLDGIERLELGQVSEAVERFQKALNIDPEYIAAYSALGRAFFKLRQWDNASEQFRRALALKAKKGESEKTRQKNESPGADPDATPPTPANKPKGNQ